MHILSFLLSAHPGSDPVIFMPLIAAIKAVLALL
jgi:hypothetical protein